MGSNIFTFYPDATFRMTAKSYAEWQDIEEVTIIFKGTYTIEDNFLMIKVTQTIVKPPEAIAMDDDLRNPIFIYGGKTGKMEYSLKDGDNILTIGIGKIVTDANRFRDDLTDIAITQSSGNTGIAYWFNSFLDLDDSECISENHPAVRNIKEWIDEQYANDRMIPITDEEILILSKKYLPGKKILWKGRT